MLLAVGGCASDAGDRLVKQQIALLEEQAEAIETDAPEETKAAIKSRQGELQKELDSLKLSDRKMANLLRDNKEAFQKARKRLLTATKGHLEKAIEGNKGILDTDKAK